MPGASINLRKILSEELDTEKLHTNFLLSLLELQKVERGSIWVKSQSGYLCIEAAGRQSEKIKGIIIPADRPSIVGWVIENGKMTVSRPDQDARHFKDVEEQFDVKSTLILCFPLLLRDGTVFGAVQIIDTSTGGKRINLDKHYLHTLQEIVDIGSMALSNSLLHADQIRENLKLKQTIEAMRPSNLLVGKSESFLRMLKVARDYARTDFPVLITGESGTGKELVAREIHRQSNRREKPILVQNCSAIPETLLESELFGYVKGAFTGALKDKVGLFEAADGGTLFLDEIGDMPFHLQARMLRVLQNSEIKPLGGTRSKRVDVRIISATNKDLREAIQREQFREDLFYRLNVLPLHIPSLRERSEDVPLLLDHFLKMECLRMGLSHRSFSKEAMEYLVDYPWKGNVRELENFVRHILVVSDGERITSKDLSLHFAGGLKGEPESSANGRISGHEAEPRHARPPASESPFAGYTWEELERAYVLYLLEKHKWHITRAAQDAGLNRSTFDSRMRKLGIRK